MGGRLRGDTRTVQRNYALLNRSCSQKEEMPGRRGHRRRKMIRGRKMRYFLPPGNGFAVGVQNAFVATEPISPGFNIHNSIGIPCPESISLPSDVNTICCASSKR